ncbi:MAG TPA: transketolase [Dehalococcoidia bacterium]|nr:transketolase [Dehalococcoidia bacterium]
MTTATDVTTLCINTIRTLAMDAVQQAGSGHPGTAMALAPLTFQLFTKHLRHNPANPRWPGRDRFVLSAGHASILQYGALYLTGYDLALDEIKRLRQWDSKTPGHPEIHLTAGLETTTGPLGQGIATAVGMALAEAMQRERFNRPGFEIVDNWTYVIASDGDMMEGVSSEASSIAGFMRLGRLIVFYDDNRITIDGSTDLAFKEDVAARYDAYGWHTQHVDDANDLDQIDRAIEAAQADERPSLIVVRSHIAWGAPNKQDTASAHGSPLGEEEVAKTKEFYGWPDEKFYVPDEALAYYRRCVDRGRDLEDAWNQLLDRYHAEHPALAAEFMRRLERKLPDGWEKALPTFDNAEDEATRASSSKVLQAIADVVPELIGGSADLIDNTNTRLKEFDPVGPGNYGGRNIHFGVREHGMGAIVNGMTLYGGLRPIGATFLIFSDYMRPAVRLAALMECPSLFVWSHDSVGLGGDGPTHQPVEHLMSLRAMPNLTLIRPADGAEVAMAWKVALEKDDGPTAIALTRQKVKAIDRTRYASAEGLMRGAYVLAESGRDLELILIATGSEVWVALEAFEQLAQDGVGVRLVSMPSWELFDIQPQAYREQVLPEAVQARVSVEAGTPLGWERWVGRHGEIIGLDHFGKSAEGELVLANFGFNPDNVVERARSLMEGTK